MAAWRRRRSARASAEEALVGVDLDDPATWGAGARGDRRAISTPLTDMRASAAYRGEVAANLLHARA